MPQLRILCALLTLFLPLSAYARPTRALLQAQASDSTNFDALAQQASAARESGHSAEAIALYRRALALRQDWVEGWWYLGTLLYDSDQFAEAIPAFQNVAKLAPDAPGALDFLGLCEFETGDYDSALQHLQAGRSSAPQEEPQLARSASYHFALLLNRAGDFDRALQLLSGEFAQAAHSGQLSFAFGLAMLHVPLLPNEVDPSNEALLHSVGRLGIYAARGRNAQAIEGYPQLLQQYPKIPFLHAAYASALKSAGRDQEAAAELLEEVHLHPKAPDAQDVAALYVNDAGRRRLGLAISPAPPLNAPAASFDALSVRAAEAIRNDRPEEAIPLLQQALALRPDWQAGRWELASLLFSSKRCGEAVPVLKTYLSQDAKSGTGWVMLGLCEFESKDYDNALLHLEKATTLGLVGPPGFQLFFRYRTALLLIHKSSFERATAFIVEEAEGNPSAQQMQFALGLALLHKNLFPEEVPAAQIPLVQSAGQVSLLLHNTKYDQAFVLIEQLLKQYPDTPWLHYSYGLGLASLSRPQEAEAQFKEECRLSPNSPLLYIELAFVQLQMHRPSDALASSQRAVQLNPDSAEAHFVFGRSLFDSGKFQEALQELQSAEQIKPGNPDVHLHLAKAYTKLHRGEDAEREAALFDHLKSEIEKQNSLHRNQANAAPQNPAEAPDASASPRPSPQF